MFADAHVCKCNDVILMSHPYGVKLRDKSIPSFHKNDVFLYKY